MNDQEDASKQGGIAELDADEDVTLEDVDVEVAMDADVHGRLVESQVKPAEVEEVIEVVTAAKLMTEVVTGAAATISAAQVPKASAPKRRKGVVIQDPEETATASIIMHSEVKSKDKGKGILIEKPKPLKRQAQIEQDEAFARQLEAELNANINWNDVVDQKKRSQVRKKKEAKEKVTVLTRMQQKKQRIYEEEKELKRYLHIVVNDDDDVYTEATPLALKMFMLVEKKYPLTRFTLEQMLNNVRLEVEEESEMSLELLRLMRRQLQKDIYQNKEFGYILHLIKLVKLKKLDV
nr:hypothetical protein [Tanacetum cinerariifolium]